MAARSLRLSEHLNKLSIRYLFFGGANTALTFLIYAGLILVNVHYLVANSIAWIVGITVSFLFNSKYVFKRNMSLRRFINFSLANGVSYFVSSGFLILTVRGFGMDPIFASFLAIPVVVTSNYVLFKLVVFR